MYIANYSALHFTLQIRRNLTYHLVQTYLPAVLLMLITWLCFLLPVDMVEARIGISMTTLLTLTAMFAAVREQAPEVSYTMAIDIWMVFCIGLVFLALVLFTVVHWMQRKLQQFQEVKGNKEQAENGELGMPNGDQTEESRPLPKKEGKKQKRHLDESDTFINLVDKARRYAFWLFALVFILFLSVYTAWILIGSQHFDWTPNPKFNAVEDPNNDTNHLFVFKSTKFAKDVVNDPYKETASENRYGDIVDDVIKPRLAQRTGQD
ncbi:Glutamate-gated chloride channel alpha [Folsomia candida]|uniref:Glutamate-gated chloride channel alpha n=1 Tax=Folsomia candida TaxID=158441 RepID=A0A226DXP7_FOLCA|nr:Glutamate-gated chloride channel alpha [Folsomia candida]